MTEQDIAEAKRALKELADEAQGNGNSEGWIAAKERPIRAVIAAHEAKAEPFGYFRAEPMGWTDCAATDEGAIALYERPAVPDVDSLAQFIRQIDGSHTMGTAALAERICEWLNDRKATEQAAPAVPQGTNWHAHHVIVDKAALQMVRNALRNDMERGLIVRGEMLEELDKVTYSATPAAPSQEPAVPQVWFNLLAEARNEAYDEEGYVMAPCLASAVEDIDAMLAAPSQGAVTLSNRQFDLICQAIDKADTITMDGDYMMDSDDCIAVVRVMQALFDIAALREKQGGV